MNWFERYESGDHAAVYYEVLACPVPDQRHCDAVARAVMKRVRKNVETLIVRWREAGFILTNPIGRPGEARAAVRRVEQEWGPLPTTLRALYHELGFVNL